MTTTKNQSIYARLCSATARIEKVIWIAGMMGDADLGETPASDLDDLFNQDSETLNRLFPGGSRWIDELEHWDSTAGEFQWWVIKEGRMGFLVKIATPVMVYLTKTSCEYSWGYYRTHWAYGESPDEALRAGLAWVKRVRKDEKAEFSNGKRG